MPAIGVLHGTMHYSKSGSGPPVVLLHGIQGTSGVWTEVTATLSAGQTVYVPDLRGRAPSLIPTQPADYSLAHFADDLRRLLEVIGEETAVVGWSMGSLVVLEYLRQGWTGLSCMVLAAGTACPGEDAQWFSSRSLADIAAEARARAQRLELTSTAAPRAVAASWQHVMAADYRSMLPRITIPTLIVHGRSDDQSPITHGEQLAGLIPGASLEIWDDAGHDLMRHDRHRFCRLLQQFLASTQGA